MRKRWGSKRVTKQVGHVVKDSPAPGPPWDLRDALALSGNGSNSAAFKIFLDPGRSNMLPALSLGAWLEGVWCAWWGVLRPTRLTSRREVRSS